MNVNDIIKQYLIDNSLDGLYNQEGECACELSDLQPCGENHADCMPGIKKSWNELTDKQKEHLEPECEFYIVKC